jgi:hypothetical protein
VVSSLLDFHTLSPTSDEHRKYKIDKHMSEPNGDDDILPSEIGSLLPPSRFYIGWILIDPDLGRRDDQKVPYYFEG